MLMLEQVVIRQDDFTLTADWQVDRGEKIAVIGPSGGGKSTLLACIAGFVMPESGRILVDGQDITTTPPGQRPVSLLFQDHNLFAHLNLADNLGLGLSPSLRLTADDRRRIDAALVTVGLAGLGLRKPASLSGGQQSRAALARILLMSRPIVLMDEPFSALGPAMKAEMLDLVQQTIATSRATLLMVTHDPKDAIGFADRTVLLDEGVAEPPVATEALFTDPPPGLRRYLG